MRPIPVVLNAHAGTHAGDVELARRVEHAFESVGAHARVTCASRDTLVDTLQTAAEEAGDILAVGGGDGTLSTAASVLKGTSTALGVLPLGTVNYFARTIGVPLDVEEAVRVIVRGRTEAVDLGRLGDRVFLNNSSLGVYPHVMSAREQHRKENGWKDRAVAIAAMARAFWDYGSLDITIRDAEPEGRLRTPVLVVGNNAYQPEGPGLPRRKRLDDGQLWLCTAPGVRRISLLRAGLQLALGLDAGMRELEEDRTTSLSVTWRGGAKLVTIDGETVRLRPPLAYSIESGALTVRCPESASTSRAEADVVNSDGNTTRARA